MRRPDFIIAGTQKAGTTWLEHNLSQHPEIFTPRKQLHFFDQNFDRGLSWYCDWFKDVDHTTICGEKTTEYFDPLFCDKVFDRISEVCPDAKIVIVLRNPTKRAQSALAHVVRSGLMPIPTNPDAALFDDQDLPTGEGFRFIERGFYAEQLKQVYKHIPRENVLVQIFEEDIVENPQSGLSRVFSFLGLPPVFGETFDTPVNKLRLSRPALSLTRLLYSVPYARGIIRRVNDTLGLLPWEPEFSPGTNRKLDEIYRARNSELFSLLGRTDNPWGMSDG